MVGSLGQIPPGNREQECKAGVEIVPMVKGVTKADFRGISKKVRAVDYAPPADSVYDVFIHEASNTVQLFYQPTDELVNCSKISKYPWMWNAEDQCRFYYDTETKDICKKSAEALDAKMSGDADEPLDLWNASILFVGTAEQSVLSFNRRGRDFFVAVDRDVTLDTGT